MNWLPSKTDEEIEALIDEFEEPWIKDPSRPRPAGEQGLDAVLHAQPSASPAAAPPLTETKKPAVLRPHLFKCKQTAQIV